MSSTGTPPALPPPSVFISYASEDRAAARLLRDTLIAAGLDVWYDESELVGGDAWDQKIRRQIRECDYFMPVISANTERRKEGYFRREWRLATERTMDMSDDVLFLLPVAIDNTNESAARVPEKFLAVQWLRLPAGEPRPILQALTRRLLAREHNALPRPPAARIPLVPMTGDETTAAPWSNPPASAPAAADPGDDDRPPPMPPFPHPPEKSGLGPWLKFMAEILWWGVTAVWVVLSKLPRWARVLIAVWLLFSVIGTCRPSRSITSPPPGKKGAGATRDVSSSDISQAIEMARQAFGEGKDLSKEARRAGKSALDPAAAGKPIVLVPFSVDPTDIEAERFALTVFAKCHEELEAARPGEAAVTVVSIGSITTESLAALGRNLGTRHIVGGQVTTANGARVLALKLLHTPIGTEAWSAEIPLAGSDPAKVAHTIVEAVLQNAPKRKQPPR